MNSFEVLNRKPPRGVPIPSNVHRPMLHPIPTKGTTLEGMGRRKVYELLKAGALQAKRVGRRTLITDESLVAFLAEQPPVVLGSAPNKLRAA